MQKQIIREKYHRLPEEIYRGFNIVAFTACIKERISFFTTEDRFKQCEELLLDSLQKHQSSAEVYVFMPDHVHLLLRGESETSDVLKAMKLFKQKSGFWLSKNYHTVLWQKDFYDHILRKDQDLPKQINYILNNPVRAGIVDTWKQYPFKGSTRYNLNEWNE